MREKRVENEKVNREKEREREGREKGKERKSERRREREKNKPGEVFACHTQLLVTTKQKCTQKHFTYITISNYMCAYTCLPNAHNERVIMYVLLLRTRVHR